jgi:threonyl-tRNA synthetase
VLGKREVEERAVNIRRLGSKDQASMGLEAAVAALREESLPPDERRKAAAAEARAA